MADEREREISRPSLADAIDLLDLVRSTEDSARVSTESPAPSEEEPSAPSEDFVDVGDEAVELAPSLPPTKLSGATKLKTPLKVKPIPLAAVVPAVSDEERMAMPPAVSIVLVLGLAIGSLYAILALPTSGPAPARNLGAEPANLQVEGRPE